jgi:hypothetical protein
LVREPPWHIIWPLAAVGFASDQSRVSPTFMDWPTASVVITGLTTLGRPSAEESAKLVADFIRALLLPTAQAVGGSVADWAKDIVARGTTVVLDAAKTAQDLGVKPKPVPASLLVPLMAKASLEEDENLHERWVELLANAAMKPGSVLPAFVHILGEMSPLEARLLKKVHEVSSHPVLTKFSASHPMNTAADHQLLGNVLKDVTHNALMQHLGISQEHVHDTYLVMIGNLERLQLIHHGYIGGPVDALMLDSNILLTEFGKAFMQACTVERSRSQPGGDV